MEESLFLVLLCVFSINLRFRFRLQDQVQVLYTTGSLISSVLLAQSFGFCKQVPQPNSPVQAEVV